jgi:hypothetical protein
MFGASQIMFTGGRPRRRPPALAGAPFRPVRRHPRRYDLTRRYCPFACPISRRIRGPSFWIATGTAGGAVLCKLLEDGIRSREIRGDPNFAGPVANRAGARHCVGDRNSYGRRLTRRAERTDWPA